MFICSQEIQDEHDRLGHRLGWRWLATPMSTLKSAHTAILTLNPGGRYYEEPVLSCENGNAYFDESWKGRRAGSDPLQVQIQRLIALSGATKTTVCIGHLVPFRSPDWRSLDRKIESLSYGFGLWQKATQVSRFKTIFMIGNDTAKILIERYGAHLVGYNQTGWGSATSGHWVDDNGRAFIGLPHLSRFAVLGRSTEFDRWIGQICQNLPSR
jgi:hypothetical protein